MVNVFSVVFVLMHVHFMHLYMTNDYELSSFSKEGLIYTPAQLQVKPYVAQDSEIIITDRGASHG